MKELKRVVISYKIDGEKYEVRKPNVSEIRELSKAKDDDNLKVIQNLLDKLGLPSKVFDTLEVQQVHEIIQDLIGGKNQTPLS